MFNSLTASIAKTKYSVVAIILITVLCDGASIHASAAIFDAKPPIRVASTSHTASLSLTLQFTVNGTAISQKQQSRIKNFAHKVIAGHFRSYGLFVMGSVRSVDFKRLANVQNVVHASLTSYDGPAVEVDSSWEIGTGEPNFVVLSAPPTSLKTPVFSGGMP
jgi:hypothetical protein